MASFHEKIRLFTVEQEHELVKRSTQLFFYPDTPIQSDYPIQVRVPPCDYAYDLQSIRVIMEMRVTKKDGSNLKDLRVTSSESYTTEVDEIDEDTATDVQKAKYYFQKTQRLQEEIGFQLNRHEEDSKGTLEQFELPMVVDNFAQSIWSDVCIELNNQQITENAAFNSHPYISWIRKILSKEHEFQEKRALELFTTDTPVKSELWEFDNNSVIDNYALSLAHYPSGTKTAERAYQFRLSKTVTTVSPVGMDLFDQKKGKYLLPGNFLKFTFYMNSPNFFLMEPENADFQLEILSLKLAVKAVELDDKAMEILKKHWESEPCIYPIKQSKLLTYSLDAGKSSFVYNLTLTENFVPDLIAFGLVPTNYYSGSFEDSPYTFRLSNVKSAMVTLNGVYLSGIAGQYIISENLRESFRNFQMAVGTDSVITYDAYRTLHTVCPTWLRKHMEP